MDPDLREDLLKIKSDGYKQLLLKQDQSLISLYEKRLNAAYSELENIIDPDIYEKIIHISDQILQAVISHTFDCFANMLAERDIENEEAEEEI
jgi:hypothetical protein